MASDVACVRNDVARPCSTLLIARFMYHERIKRMDGHEWMVPILQLHYLRPMHFFLKKIKNFLHTITSRNMR